MKYPEPKIMTEEEWNKKTWEEKVNWFNNSCWIGDWFGNDYQKYCDENKKLV